MRSPFVRALALLACAAAPLIAQPATGSIAGTVTDPIGRPIAGVRVVVEADGVLSATEVGGRYRLPRVAAGSRTVTFRYIGFAPVSRSVTVTAGQLVTVDVRFERAAERLAAVEVRGQVAGQAAALNQQRTSLAVTSVIDNELVGRLPDPNLAEALARVPGVAMVRDQGEGRFVQIRGTAADLNSMSINGLRVATPEQSSRQLPMDVIPSDQAGSIQVSKTLTPDMDADAIGGNVNIVTRSAVRGRPVLNVTTAGGQNQLGGGALINAGLNAGARFGTNGEFGAMVGGTYYRNDRASQNYEGTWCSQDRDCGATTDPSRNSLDAPRLWELRDYPQVNRLRQGANATFDWTPNSRNKLFLRGTYNTFSDDEIRFRTRYGFRAGGGSRWTLVTPDSGTTTGSRMDRDVRLRKVDQEIVTAQFGGEHSTAGGTQLDWVVGSSRAREDRPDVRTIAFRQGGMSFGYNFADADRPRVNVITGSFDDPTRFAFNSLAREVRLTTDEDVSGRVNVSVPFLLGQTSGTFKAGLSYRGKTRENLNTVTNFTSALGTNSLGATGATLLSQLTTSTTANQLFGGDYTLGRMMDPAATAAFIRNNAAAFTQDVAASTIASAGNTFSVRENVTAGYVMATLDAGDLTLVPGVRVEATAVDNAANRLRVQGTTVTVTPESRTASYFNAFPSLHATWRANDRTNVRAAITTSLVRPQFLDMVPYVNITVGQPTVAIGNPDLRATTAVNYDLMVERYFENVGFVSAGYFVKDLANFIFPTSRPVQPGEQFGPDANLVIQAQNGPTARISGLELAWQQQLTFLPGALAGFGLNANYTLTRSTATLAARPGVTVPLPGQTGNAGNVGLFYDRGPVSVRLGGNYSGEFLSTINPVTPEGDTRTLARFQVDAAGSFRLTSQIKLFAEAINLTNTPLRATVGNRTNRGGGGDDPSFEFYRSWAMIGLRFER
jgi:TonB-dependent receptor